MIPTMLRFTIFQVAATCLVVLAFSASTRAEKLLAKPPRAAPPNWEKFPSDIFFKNAFREGLVGERPATLGKRPDAVVAESATGEAPDRQAVAGTHWSEFVSARTLEDEVKSLQIAVQSSVTTPGRFSGGGYQKVRRQFTELAALFAVIHEFDRKVRWQDDAALARDGFARAAANAKVTSTQAFNDAKQRKLDLEELVRGGKLASNKPVEPQNDWSKICDRGPLMQRFTRCFDDGLMVWTTSKREMEKHRADIKREAELLKMFAEILTRDGMDDAGDDDYDNYCDQLSRGADDVLRAVREGNAMAARKATAILGKSCTHCHEDYRG